MKGYKVKAKNCDGSITVGSPKDMYYALYEELRNEEQVMDIIKWARRKKIGEKFENDILTVEIIER